MSVFQVGEVVFVKKTNERVRISRVRESKTISGKHTDYLCEFVDIEKSGKAFAPADLERR